MGVAASARRLKTSTDRARSRRKLHVGSPPAPTERRDDGVVPERRGHDTKETDADGDSFEVHITKADGTRATVKLSSDFSVAAVQDDASGGRGGRGDAGCDGDGDGGGGRAKGGAAANDASNT